jgi:hypothetical protein
MLGRGQFHDAVIQFTDGNFFVAYGSLQRRISRSMLKCDEEKDFCRVGNRTRVIQAVVSLVLSNSLATAIN